MGSSDKLRQKSLALYIVIPRFGVQRYYPLYILYFRMFSVCFRCVEQRQVTFRFGSVICYFGSVINCKAVSLVLSFRLIQPLPNVSKVPSDR